MPQYSKIVSFGASVTLGVGANGLENAWSAIIAKNLKKQYICLAEAGSSNSTITRNIVSSDIDSDCFVLAMWVSTTRFEFWNENKWKQFTPWDDQTGFVKDWYRGPGQWEYTGVSMALKEIYLAQSYLNSKNIPYLFTIDNDEIHKSWLIENDNSYINKLHSVVDWSKFVFFDGHGFIPWCEQRNFALAKDGHPGPESHQAAADHILKNSF